MGVPGKKSVGVKISCASAKRKRKCCVWLVAVQEVKCKGTADSIYPMKLYGGKEVQVFLTLTSTL